MATYVNPFFEQLTRTYFVFGDEDKLWDANKLTCVTEEEREQYNIAIAKGQTCMSEEDLKSMVEKRDEILSLIAQSET